MCFVDLRTPPVHAAAGIYQPRLGKLPCQRSEGDITVAGIVQLALATEFADFHLFAATQQDDAIDFVRQRLRRGIFLQRAQHCIAHRQESKDQQQA